MGEALAVSREENRLAKVIDMRRWREEKARQTKPAPAPPPPPEPRPRGLALTLGLACCAFGLGLVYLPFWALVRGVVAGFSLSLLFGLVLYPFVYAIWLVRRDPGLGDRVGSIVADE